MLDISPLIICLQDLPAELICVFMYTTSIVSLGIFYRVLGVSGVFMFMALCVIIANIQVLKAMELVLFHEPVAMGTTIFMVTYLATDLLAELHGRAIAQKAIICGFFGVMLITVIMVLTLGIPPITRGLDANTFNDAHYAICTLFSPAPAIFMASIISYFISRYTDVAIFLGVKKLTRGSFLWLRSFVSTGLSSLLDSTVFSVLAWKILAPLNISMSTLIFSYILGTYTLRLIITVINIPVLYILTSICRPKDKSTAQSI